MIPRIIHYCWLSNDNIPDKLEKCMHSWKEKLHGYEFVLWNFNRFDINLSTWVRQAFEAKKYAFAADFIRLYAVYHYGGIYLDMDIEIIKPFDDLLNKDIMMAYEDNYAKTIEAGVFGAEIKSPIIEKCLNYYNGREFIKSDGVCDTLPLPRIMKDVCSKISSKNIFFYASDYFTAKSYRTGIIAVTSNTYCIHHFAGSWVPDNERVYLAIKGRLHRIFGYRLSIIISFPIFVVISIKNHGINNGLKAIWGKVKTTLA